MKNPIGSFLLLAVLMLVSTSWIGCDSDVVDVVDDPPGALSGVVRERGTERPLSDLTVKLNNVQTTTGPEGRFEFGEVPVGIKTLRISTSGFFDYARQIDVQAGDNSLDISLVRKTYYEFSSGTSDDYGIYLPAGVSTFRGVIFLVPPAAWDTRGFASSIDRDSPPHPEGWNEYVAAERQRSLLLAETYGLALMGADVSSLDAYFRVLEVLEQFAKESGHPELALVPLLAMGFSFGGCFAYEFTLRHPERVIGFMTEKGACHSTQDAGLARLVPGYLFIGELDGPNSGPQITRLFEDNRSQGALWALAVEPGSGHVPVKDQTLLFNWMDAVLKARLPETVTPGSPVILRPLDETAGWLVQDQGFFCFIDGSTLQP